MKWFIAFLLIAGLALAGSESPWFPTPNILGVLAVGISALLGWSCEQPPKSRLKQ